MTFAFGKLTKSVLSCIPASWLGLTLVVVFEEMRGNAYLLSPPAHHAQWLREGGVMALQILVSIFPMFVLLPMLVVGLPLQALLQRFGRTGYLWTVIPALPIGPLVLMALFVIFDDLLKGSLDPYALVLTAVGGFVCTSIFWLIRRPDKDMAPSISKPS